jgi:putative transposase
LRVYAFIQAEKATHPKKMLCRVMGFPKSSLYYRESVTRRPPSAAEVENERIKERIKAIHRDSLGTYGSPRITAALRREGEVVNQKRVRRLMHEAGLVGITRRRAGRSKAATLAAGAREARVAQDLVQRAFSVDAPDLRWYADITEHPTDEGKLYLASVLDAFDKQVVGWSMGENATAELVVNAVEMAISRRKPIIAPVHHSDRGTQYTSIAFSERLEQLGLRASMGSRGDAYDNAVIESWHATLQTELLDRQDWRARDQLRTAIFHFIEVFYNRQRLHSSLGYHSPAEFHRRYAQQAAVGS